MGVVLEVTMRPLMVLALPMLMLGSSLGQLPVPGLLPTAQRQQPNPPSSGAGQTLALDVPTHAVDVVWGRPTNQSITASVLAYQEGEGYLEYGLQAGMYDQKTALRSFAKDQPTEIIVDGLQPNTQYFYRFLFRPSGGNFSTQAEQSVRTQRPAGSPFSFVIQADSHLDSNSSLDVYARSLANQQADQPDFRLDLGDTFMTDKYQPYLEAHKQYLAQRYFLGQLSPLPLFLVLGNHDGEGSSRGGAASSMGQWANQMRTRYFPNPVAGRFYSGNPNPDAAAGIGQNYYAFEWGDALLVVLDLYSFTPSQRGNADNWTTTLGKAQYDWLEQTLAGSRAKWKLIFIHQMVGGLGRDGRGGAEAARFFEWGGHNADGSDGFAEKRPGWAMPIHALLLKHKVSAVFHGHDHLFVKQDLDGIVYQEVPQPSNARFGNTNSAKEYGYASGDMLGGPGHLRVKVAPEQLTVEYVRAYLPKDENAQRKNGQVDYSYTLKPQ